jgi:putative hydrolase of the HAD superfamily
MANQAFTAYVRDLHALAADAGSLLESLAGRFPLALITNGAPDSQREKLQSTGLESAFDAILISGELGIAKPDPRIFHLALDKLGVPAEAAWHIGDTPATDVAGARAAGITAIWLNRTTRARRPEEPAPDAEIQSLSEVTTLLIE